MRMRRLGITLAVAAGMAAAPLLTMFGAQAASSRLPSPIHLPASLASVSGYEIEDALPGLKFRMPLAIASVPQERDRLFVVEKIGTIQVVTGLSATPRKKEFMNLPAILAAHHEGTLLEDTEWGLKGLEFHPDFAHNGYLYITYDFSSPDPDGTKRCYNRLSRFSVSKKDPDAVDPDSEMPLITQVDRASNHNGGDVHFGPEGYLYYSMGDEGGQDDHFDNGRFIDKNFFAGIFRLDVDHRAGSLEPNPHHQDSAQFPSAVHPHAYWIPSDNPFIGAKEHNGKQLDPAMVRTEYYCCGLRNPWRFCFDSSTGTMLIGDVGQGKWEEIDVGVAGANFGWSYKEGLHNGPRNRAMPKGGTWVDPIYEYPHGEGAYDGDCIIGGQFYHCDKLPELSGKYIFADYTRRHIWALLLHDGKWGAMPLVNGPDVAGMGIDPRNGDVLFCHFLGGHIEHLVRKNIRGEEPPALLSQTGAFTDLKTLTPAPGVTPFTPNVSFWSDHALKSRWFSLPTAADKISIVGSGDFSFPTGSVFVKHFDMELRPGDPASRQRLETRFIVKTPTSVYGLTYRWRKDQSDADLVPEGGANEQLTITENGGTRTQTWRYPSRTECLTCHTDATGGVLGFNRLQLNGPAGADNQLVALQKAGYFDTKIGDVEKIPALADMNDTKATLDWRVRSYLAVNCVMCHQPGAVMGSWDARATSNNSLLFGIRPLDMKGDNAWRMIAPGDVGHSMVLQRMKANGVPRMPPVGSNELDEAAIKMVTEWVNELGKGPAGGGKGK